MTQATAGVLPERYRDPERIARGGMGDIYRATDSVLGRTVAVKVLGERFAWDDEVRRRFTREALAAARLSGEPRIVTIFDVGEHEERPYIVMEYLDGGSLERVVQERGAVEPATALPWLEDAATALDAAHAHGVVHRDVKPANLLLDPAGRVHVADFGIASAAGTQSLTQPGTILGTAGYLAPEQAQGQTVGPAADRYALAVVAFELLTGRRPFADGTETAEAAAHVNAPVPDISARNRELPPTLDPVLRRGLAKDPDDRYASAAELVADLRAALAEEAEPTRAIPAPVPPAAHAPPRTRRPGSRALVAAAFVGVGILGAGAAALLATRDDEGGGEASPSPSTLVTTIVTTLPATTREVTVTAETPTTAPTTTTEGAGGTIGQAIALTDEATQLLREQRWEEALTVGQRALAILEGTGQTYEGYANYDVGRALAELGRCDEALPYLERREQLLGPHADVNEARSLCENGQ